MAFVSGPRQVGKTTLAKTLLRSTDNYRSWDDVAFRKAWSRSPRRALADRGPGPIILDEIHKDRRWKTRLKGFYDAEGAGQGIIVTGSARLDLYRRGGDSLLGRYLPYRLHPRDLHRDGSQHRRRLRHLLDFPDSRGARRDRYDGGGDSPQPADLG